MEVLVSIFFGLFLFPVVASECQNFKLYDGTNEVTDFSCQLHSDKACLDGPSSFPDGLGEGSSVAKPRNCELKGIRENFTIPNTIKTIVASGVTYTWRPPLDTLSRNHTKGYYLKMQRVGSAKIICRLIDLRNFSLTASNDFHFSLKIFPFNNQSPETYVVELTSLPPPTPSEYEQGLVDLRVITVQPYWDPSEVPVIYPTKWSTWINVNQYEKQGIVEVMFGFPTPDSLANFTKFTVLIVQEGESNSLYEQTVEQYSSETVGKLNFTNVPTGTYKIQVLPVDRFYNQNGKCQCWERDDTINLIYCSTCGFVITEHFNFTSSVSLTSPDFESTAVTTVAPTSATTLPRNPGGNPETSDNKGLIIGLTVPLVLIAVIIALALAVCYKRGKMGQFCGDGTDKNMNNKREKPFIHIIDITGGEKELKAPQLNRKKILLLASQDHECFIQAVEKFAQFLEIHCMCDVMFAPQQMPQLRNTGNSYCWLSRQIDNADYVIIVTSEAALQLFLAFRKGNGFTKADLGPEGDLFTPGIQHICGKIANNEDVRNIMMVYFDHTSPTARLPIAPLPSFHYHMPNHLPTFLCHIHSLDKNRMDLSQVNMPLMGNVNDLEEGQEWLVAVQKTAAYEKQHPKWFEDKFGKPSELYPSTQNKPDYNKQESEDSGYIESRNSKELKRRLSSASNHAVEDMDPGSEQYPFSKHDFFEPSMFTTNTAYTIPPPSSGKQYEMDDTSLSEEFHRINMQYESDCFDCDNQGFQHPDAGGGGDVMDPQGNHFLDLRHADNYANATCPQTDKDQDCISLSSAQSV